jgi:hypothetical protein
MAEAVTMVVRVVVVRHCVTHGSMLGSAEL